MSIFLTIFSGTAVFVLGQFILKLIIDPINDFKKCISKIVYDLILYAHIFSNPKSISDEKMRNACQVMRQHSSTLHASLYMIPAYKVLRFVFALPETAKVIEVTKHLIALSNGHDNVLANQGILNSYEMQYIKQKLGIIIPDGEYINPEHEQRFIKAKED